MSAVLGVVPEGVWSGGSEVADFISEPACGELVADFQQGDGSHLGEDVEASRFGDGVKVGLFKLSGKTFTEQTYTDNTVKDPLSPVGAVE